MTIIEKLAEFGQSIWLDNINRQMIESERLKEMVNLGLRGMTSNPSIFDKAIRLSKWHLLLVRINMIIDLMM